MQVQLIQLHLSQKLIQQYHNYKLFLIDEKEINIGITDAYSCQYALISAKIRFKTIFTLSY